MQEDNFAQNLCTIESYAFMKSVKTLVQVLSTKKHLKKKNQLVSMLSKNNT